MQHFTKYKDQTRQMKQDTPKTNEIKYIVFDFDGTLANTLEAIRDIAKDEVGIISDEDFEMMRLEGIKGVIKRYDIKAWELPKVIARFSSKLKKRNDVNLYPQIVELIETITPQYKVGILSSNSEDNIRQTLDRYNITNKFEFIYSQSSLFGKDKVMKKMCKRHQIGISEIIYIGDEDRDITACKKVGIKCIAVTYGFNNRERIIKTKPDYIVDSPMEIAEVVRIINQQ